MINTIYLGNDHNGYHLKQSIKDNLSRHAGYEVIDLGSKSDQSVDYPGFGQKVAEKVAADPQSVGIVICGSGIGITMAANKVRGIRAANCNSIEMARSAREHNGANILGLGANQHNNDEIMEIVNTFLNTPIDPAERHKRRREQLDAL